MSAHVAKFRARVTHVSRLPHEGGTEVGMVSLTGGAFFQLILPGDHPDRDAYKPGQVERITIEYPEREDDDAEA